LEALSECSSRAADFGSLAEDLFWRSCALPFFAGGVNGRFAAEAGARASFGDIAGA